MKLQPLKITLQASSDVYIVCISGCVVATYFDEFIHP